MISVSTWNYINNNNNSTATGIWLTPDTPVFFDDFIVGMPSAASIPNETPLGYWIVERNGTNSNVFIQTSGSLESGHPGLLGFTVDGAGSSSGISMGSPNGTIDLDSTMNITYQILVRIPTVSPLTSGYYYRIGLHDSYSASDPTNGIYFEHGPETSPTWKAICNSGGTKTSLTGPAVSANQWIKLVCSIVGTSSATFSIRDTTAGTLTNIGTTVSNIPSGAQLSPNIRLFRDGAGSNLFQVYCDYWYHTYNFTTNR